MSLPPALYQLQHLYFHIFIFSSVFATVQGFYKKTKDSSAVNEGVMLPGTSIFGLLMHWFSYQLLMIQCRTICQIFLEVLPCWGLFCYENRTHLNFPYILDTSSGLWAWSIPKHPFIVSCLSFSWHQVTTAFQKTHALVELAAYVQLTKYLILWNCYFRVLLIPWGVLTHMVQWLPR